MHIKTVLQLLSGRHPTKKWIYGKIYSNPVSVIYFITTLNACCTSNNWHGTQAVKGNPSYIPPMFSENIESQDLISCPPKSCSSEKGWQNKSQRQEYFRLHIKWWMRCTVEFMLKLMFWLKSILKSIYALLQFFPSSSALWCFSFFSMSPIATSRIHGCGTAHNISGAEPWKWLLNSGIWVSSEKSDAELIFLHPENSGRGLGGGQREGELKLQQQKGMKETNYLRFNDT